jgi:prepilin-type N-terminal cleavage/methylation domain-containing protein
MKRTTGFTLIELIAAMVVISVGFVGLARLFANTNAGLSSAEGTQRAAQYAQECAEHVLAVRRNNLDFASVALKNTMCSAFAPPAGYVQVVVRGLDPDLTVIETATNACPLNAICRYVTVTVTSTSGLNPFTVPFTLVKY